MWRLGPGPVYALCMTMCCEMCLPYTVCRAGQNRAFVRTHGRCTKLSARDFSCTYAC